MTKIRVFRLPDFGMGLVEAEILRWLVSEGDQVTEDRPLVEMESDTATVELPSPYTGRIVRTWGKPGDTIPVGEPLIAFEVEAGDSETEVEEKRHVGLSERTKDLAAALQVDLELIQPSGPQGEILAVDVQWLARALASRRRLLAVGTEWYSSKGGLSTFNRELCQALARAGNSVVCLVPKASTKERQDAEKAGVRLAVAKRVAGLDERASLLRRPALPEGFTPEIVIGHDRITGPISDALARDFFTDALRVLLIHTAPGEIERLKDRVGRATRAAKREHVQLRVAKSADIVLAVGPRLYREFQTVLSGLETPPPIFRIDPWLYMWPARRPSDETPEQPRCLILGRADDLEVKGLDIAARAMAMLPGVRPYPAPVLVIRGAQPRTEDALEERLLGMGGTARGGIRVARYALDVETLREDLRRASLLMMPSRSEGFGLVGIEGIAAGVPVLISAQSGLGEMLSVVLGNDADQIVIPVTGDRERDAKRWAEMIDGVLRDRGGAFERARALREGLQHKLSWRNGVARFLSAIAVSEESARRRRTACSR